MTRSNLLFNFIEYNNVIVHIILLLVFCKQPLNKSAFCCFFKNEVAHSKTVKLRRRRRIGVKHIFCLMRSQRPLALTISPSFYDPRSILCLRLPTIMLFHVMISYKYIPKLHMTNVSSKSILESNSLALFPLF